MSSLFFHAGSYPDLFPIGCALVSVAAAIVTLRARKQREHLRGSWRR